MSLKKIFGLIIIILIIVIGIFVFDQSSKNSTQKSPQWSTQIEAADLFPNSLLVKQIISSYLKSPGSAQFPDLIIKKKINKENKYIAFGDVDSQNSFGGLIRSHFFLEITDKGGDMKNIDNWTIDNLDLGDSVLISNGKPYDKPLSISDLSEETRMAQKQIENYYRELKK